MALELFGLCKGSNVWPIPVSASPVNPWGNAVPIVVSVHRRDVFLMN